MLEYIVLGYVLQAQEGSKEIFLFNLKISGIILCLWSLVENLESIRIAGQILFAMDSAHTVQALGAVDGGGGGGDKKKTRFSLSLALPGRGAGSNEAAVAKRAHHHHVLVVVVPPGLRTESSGWRTLPTIAALEAIQDYQKRFFDRGRQHHSFHNKLVKTIFKICKIIESGKL